MTSVPQVKLHDGTTIPQLGFGVFQVDPAETQRAVETALEVGYRHIDTAAVYGNEKGVGRAIEASGIARDELYVTTKLWNDAHKADDARRAVEASLTELGLDRVDLYLIHWPATKKYGDSYVEAWDAMQQFKADGLATSVGVSNFEEQHLDALSGETPVVNQVELHPTFQQAALRAVHADRGIVTQAWAPLGQAQDLDDATVAKIAQVHGVTPAQVIVRWHLQIGNVVFPKSVTPERIAANFDVFGFDLDDEQMRAMAGVESGHRIGPVPGDADF